LHAPALSVREAQWHFATGCAAASSGGGPAGRAFNRLPCAAADRARAHRREDNGRVIGLMQRGGSLNSSDHAPAFGLLPSAARRAPGSELNSPCRGPRRRSLPRHSQLVAKCHWAPRAERAGACRRRRPLTLTSNLSGSPAPAGPTGAPVPVGSPPGLQWARRRLAGAAEASTGGTPLPVALSSGPLLAPCAMR
jgi:hypothetical protein